MANLHNILMALDNATTAHARAARTRTLTYNIRVSTKKSKKNNFKLLRGRVYPCATATGLSEKPAVSTICFILASTSAGVKFK
jgi:hypothetical protein